MAGRSPKIPLFLLFNNNSTRTISQPLQSTPTNISILATDSRANSHRHRHDVDENYARESVANKVDEILAETHHDAESQQTLQQLSTARRLHRYDGTLCAPKLNCLHSAPRI